MIIEMRKCPQLFYRSNTFHYVILVETTCLCVTVTSLLTEFKKGKLTFRAWLPFDYSSPLLFLFVYAHQLISFTVGSVHHVACDSLICGLLVHICCQLEILECRIRKGTRNPKILRDCVFQHNHIFKFVSIEPTLRIKIFFIFLYIIKYFYFNICVKNLQHGFFIYKLGKVNPCYFFGNIKLFLSSIFY